MEYQRRKPSRNEQSLKAENELNGYRARVAQIMRLKDRRREIETNYTAIRCIDYSKLRVQGGAPFNAMVETAVQWADLEKKIDDLIHQNEQELLMIEYKLGKLTVPESQRNLARANRAFQVLHRGTNATANRRRYELQH